MADPAEAIKRLEKRILSASAITREDAAFIARIPVRHLPALIASANAIRSRFRGNRIRLCSIVNAKSGACPEDCAFCAQSCRSKAHITRYPLMEKEHIIERAREAKAFGVRRFSIVTGGRTVSRSDLVTIAETISAIKNLGLMPCASLGLLDRESLAILKKAGLERYHHNLETSNRYFPKMCSTHSYADKLRTIRSAREVGLSLCVGGIFGLGETWRDRIDMAFSLRELDVDSVPINFLIPISGTPLGNKPLLMPLEALKIISLYRFVLPDKEIRICGGRSQVLGDCHSMIFFAGADAVMTGNYLTTPGRTPGDDIALIQNLQLRV